MWWMLAAGLVAALLGLELRRVVRARIEDAGPRRYALYMPGQPDRALRILQVGDDAHRRADPAAPAVVAAMIDADGNALPGEANIRAPGQPGLPLALSHGRPHTRRHHRYLRG